MIRKQRLSSRPRAVLRPMAVAAAVCLAILVRGAHAQTGKLILPAGAMPLKEVLDEVNRQTNYGVIINWSSLDPGKKVSLPGGEMEIKQLLGHALSGTRHTWEVVNGRIVITYAPAAAAPRNTADAVLRGDFDQAQLRFVPDPWSRTQKPFENMVNTRVVKMNDNGRDSTGMAVVNFRVGNAVVERDYMDNAHALDMLNRTFQNREVLASMEYMVITAGSSPDGNAAKNEKLAAERALALKSYVMWKFPFLDRDIIYTFSLGEDWKGLRKLVDEDAYTPYRSEILRLIDSPRSNDAKKAVLKTIGGGEAYRYIAQRMLPKLRGGAALSLHYKSDPAPVVVVEEKVIVEEKVVRDTVYVERPVEVAPPPVPDPTPAPEPAPEPAPAPVVIEPVAEPAYERKPLFALKTNLLFDLAMALNLEVEIPVGERWSVAGEFILPWWLWESKQYCFQSRSGNLEIRYWPGDRTDRRQMTGWFAGLYAGAGSFDLEWGDRGYQGKFYVSAGASGGYAHTISRNGNWRMEYALGVGYMQTKYDEYVPKIGYDDEWHLIRQRNGRHIWFGPTRAKISLVWMLNHGYRKGGAK